MTAFETRGPVSAPLHAEEMAAVTGAVAKRRQEFAAGRACARRAMAELGFPPVPLPPRPDRRPAWPEGLTGSITHTGDYCCAAVSRAGAGGIGIDAQVCREVTEDVWETIFGAEERLRVAKLPPERRPAAAAIAFSAKESFFKAQFEVTEMWVDFDAVAVAASGSALEIRILDPGLSGRLGGRTVAGRYVFDADMVITGVEV